jgi:hypothetical protein
VPLASATIKAQDTFPEPEDDDGGEGDGAEEDGSAAVVACGDAAPILEPAEHGLDAVALAIQRGVVRDGHLPTAG